MILRAVQRSGKGLKRSHTYTTPRSFAGPAGNRRRFYSSWVYHTPQMQSVQPGPLLPEGGKRLYPTRVHTSARATRPDIHGTPDPRVYSSGRWLRGDSLERESRYIRFDFAALCKRATELCPGATFIVTCEKKEGGYNRVFIFTMNNKSRVVARLPTRIAGPPKLITNSEVATIKYRTS